MLEYQNLAYIDLQKTGSTTIISVLKNYLAEEKVRKKSHGPVPRNFERDKITFISVREPLALYTSLFTFGAAENKGQLYMKLMKSGYPGLYEPNIKGFERWVDFITDPKRAELINPIHLHQGLHREIGFLSYRLLYLSIPRSGKKLRDSVTGKRNIRKLLEQHRVYNDYVRTESLGDDLFALFKRHERHLSFNYPLTTAQDLMAHMQTKNVSTKIKGVNASALSAELRQRVIDREWLFYTEFGYRQNLQGLPSDQNPRLRKDFRELGQVSPAPPASNVNT